MVKRWIPLPSLVGLAASSTAVCNIPIGPRYHIFLLSGNNKAAKVATDSINEIRLKVNGKVQRVFTYTELQALNILYGAQYGIQANSAGGDFSLPIFLAEPWREVPSARDLLAWGTGNLDSMQLEIDIKADVPDSLRVVAQIDNSVVTDAGRSVQQPMGLIVKWTRQQIPVVGTQVDAGPQHFPLGDAYQQISFFTTEITSVQFKVDNFVIREVTKVENDALLTHYGMTPVAGRFDLVFDHDDFLNSALLTTGPDGRRVQDFRILLNSAAFTAGNVATIIQRIGLPE